MEKIPQNQSGTTVPSSDAEQNFDAHTAQIPNEISSDEEPEIIPPGQEFAETGWPVSEVETIVGLPFFLLEKRYGETWEIDDKEQTHLAKSWKPILDKYLPTENSEIGTALLVTLVLVAPRLMMTDWKKAPEKKSTAPANTKTAASTASPSTSANASPVNPAEWDLLSDK
jgi:hypothetical protein